MRSLLTLGKSRQDPGTTPGRSDLLRRRAMRANAYLLLGASALAAPLAVFTLIHGFAVPFVLTVIGLATGLMSLLLLDRHEDEGAAIGQVVGIMLAGLVLTVADPAIADFGLAVALLGPIHAALLGDKRMRNGTWVLVGIVLAFALASAAGLIPFAQGDMPNLRLIGGVAFAATALVIAHTANRLNAAFEVYDRAQINAYRHLIENVQDAVLRFSTTGELLFSSRSTEKLLGCKRYELGGDGLIERVHVLDRPAYLTALSEANLGGQPRSIEVRMRYDGPNARSGPPQFVWVEIALSPVIDGALSDGRFEIVALFRDVTARRDQENEMRAARKAAEEASQAKSRFLATIGHELRTPLNAIVGFSEMMTSEIGGSLSPAHREYAELIHKSGHHLIGVVSMLLDMSRIEAGKFELHTESFAPESLIKPCLDMVEPLAREKRITLTSQLPPLLPAIVADERVCRQILLNLLSNAVKFSHPQGVVTVGMKPQGGWLNISVSDRGIGMTAEAVARVGEPFFQAQEGLARRYEGTGLGLSIVKGLVDLHGGVLSINSEAGTGTTMTVLLPINGPATKTRDTSSVTPLRREAASQPVTQWPEQKRSAK